MGTLVTTLLSLLFTTCSDPGVVPRPLPYSNTQANNFDELGLPTGARNVSLQSSNTSGGKKSGSKKKKKQIIDIDVEGEGDEDLEESLTG